MNNAIVDSTATPASTAKPTSSKIIKAVSMIALACVGCCALPALPLLAGSAVLSGLIVYSSQIAVGTILGGAIVYLGWRWLRRSKICSLNGACNKAAR